MNHPIKRFKPDDLDRYKNSKNVKYDLYVGQHHESSTLPSSSQKFAEGSNELWKNDDKNPLLERLVGKESRKSESDDKTAENLFTSEGLQPSLADLNKIFDNSDDNSNDVRLQVAEVC
jgi:threonyl-tRNA synthetase